METCGLEHDFGCFNLLNKYVHYNSIQADEDKYTGDMQHYRVISEIVSVFVNPSVGEMNYLIPRYGDLNPLNDYPFEALIDGIMNHAPSGLLAAMEGPIYKAECEE